MGRFMRNLVIFDFRYGLIPLSFPLYSPIFVYPFVLLLPPVVDLGNLLYIMWSRLWFILLKSWEACVAIL
ncbi:hypothetical protein BF27_5666 (plasmid) [Bacillus anthracis]|nr:hypothetical protein BF27_5666 [Bacillus anthracis]